MPAIGWCTNLSDTMPNAQSCCISSTGVDRPGSLHNTTGESVHIDSDTVPDVEGNFSIALHLSKVDVAAVILHWDRSMDSTSVPPRLLAKGLRRQGGFLED